MASDSASLSQAELAKKYFEGTSQVKDTFGPHDDSIPPEEHPSKWNDLWESGITVWDKGIPSPSLLEAVDVLLLRKPLPQPENPENDEDADTQLPGPKSYFPDPVMGDKRRRALVPGCGSGYDVFFLASAGYDSVGLECSATACEEARKICKAFEEGGWKDYPLLRSDVPRGKIEFRLGNFFSDKWQTDDERANGWDIIYDYAFLCALPPTLRPDWSSKICSLLAPTGNLVCVEFPTFRDPREGGPPWALPPIVYTEHLSHPGVKIPYDKETKRIIPLDKALDHGSQDTLETAPPLVRVAHWRARKAHAIGQGQDFVGIFRRQ